MTFLSLPPDCSWLIAIAYFLAGGFIKSGLGNRIAYAIVSAFGKTTLGLVYSLVSLGLERGSGRACVHFSKDGNNSNSIIEVDPMERQGNHNKLNDIYH